MTWPNPPPALGYDAVHLARALLVEASVMASADRDQRGRRAPRPPHRRPDGRGDVTHVRGNWSGAQGAWSGVAGSPRAVERQGAEQAGLGLVDGHVRLESWITRHITLSSTRNFANHSTPKPASWARALISVESQRLSA